MEDPRLEASPRQAPVAATGSFRPVRLWQAVLLFLLIAGPISFLGLGATDAVTMEGIVADGARHMARTQEYAVPHLHGEIYSYKPPLTYWLALGSFRLFGEETEWSLRFPFAASGLLMGLAVLVLTGQVAGPRAGLLCGFASLTGALAIQKLHLAEFDTPLAAGVGIAAAVACRNFAGRPRGGLWLIGYLALALAFLAKGVPALMFYAPGLLVASWLTRRHRDLWRPAHLAGAVLCLLAVAGWLAGAYQAAGEAAFAQPLAEAREKGLEWDLSLVASTLAKPLLAGALFLPWTLLLPVSFKSGRWSSEPVRRMALAAVGFVTAGVAVFMVVPATQSRYLLPLAAPMGMLCGLAARDVLGGGGFRRRAIEVFAFVIGLGVAAAAPFATSYDATSRWLWAVVAVVTLAAAARSFRRALPLASSGVWLLAMVAVLSWLIHARGVEPHRASSRSLRAVATTFEAHLEPGSELWTGPVSKHWRHSSLFFYLGRPVRTFSTGGSQPKAGDYVVLVSDEHQELMAAPPFDHEIVERQRQRAYEFLLVRVR